MSTPLEKPSPSKKSSPHIHAILRIVDQLGDRRARDGTAASRDCLKIDQFLPIQVRNNSWILGFVEVQGDGNVAPPEFIEKQIIAVILLVIADAEVLERRRKYELTIDVVTNRQEEPSLGESEHGGNEVRDRQGGRTDQTPNPSFIQSAKVKPSVPVSNLGL